LSLEVDHRGPYPGDRGIRFERESWDVMVHREMEKLGLGDKVD
jgi:hypothetical protein